MSLASAWTRAESAVLRFAEVEGQQSVRGPEAQGERGVPAPPPRRRRARRSRRSPGRPATPGDSRTVAAARRFGAVADGLREGDSRPAEQRPGKEPSHVRAHGVWHQIRFIPSWVESSREDRQWKPGGGISDRLFRRRRSGCPRNCRQSPRRLPPDDGGGSAGPWSPERDGQEPAR